MKTNIKSKSSKNNCSLNTSNKVIIAQDKDALIYAYVDAGYTLTPLNGKIPIVKSWQKIDYDPLLTPKDIKGNFGVVLQDDDIIVDVDPRNFPERDNPLKRLIKDIKVSLNSFTVKTGGGGLHIYMKKPAELKIRGILPEYPGIEFKTKGQQVVGAGSLHPETNKHYTVVKLSPADASNAPESLLNLIKRTDTLNVLENGLENYIDDKASLKRFIQYLLNCSPAIEGENGDHTTVKTACIGKDFGLSPQKTFNLMEKYWNPRCKPEWDLDELKIKVENAYRYSSGKVGSKHPSADFDNIKIPDSVNDNDDNSINGLVRPLSEAIQESKPLKFIVDDLIARDYMSFIFGPPGTGKTLFCTEFGKILSAGGYFVNRLIKPHKVILFEGDAPTSLFKGRINTEKENLNCNFRYINRFDAEANGKSLYLSCPDGRKNFKRIIKSEKPEFIIIDTLISFIESENDPEKLKPIIDFLRQIAAEFSLHIMVVHHSRKRLGGESAKKRKLDQDDMIGSSVMQRLASVIIILEKYGIQENDVMRVGIKSGKSWFRSFSPIDMLVTSYNEGSRKSVDIKFVEPLKEETAIDTAKREVLEFITQNNGTTRKEITLNLDHLSESTIKQALNSLAKEAIILAKGATKDRKFYLNTDDDILADP